MGMPVMGSAPRMKKKEKKKASKKKGGLFGMSSKGAKKDASFGSDDSGTESDAEMADEYIEKPPVQKKTGLFGGMFSMFKFYRKKSGDRIARASHRV